MKKEKNIVIERNSNLLKNPYFEGFNYWKFVDSDYFSDFIVHECHNVEGHPESFQKSQLRIYSYATMENRGIYQTIKRLSSGKYTFYVNLHIGIKCFGTKRPGIYLRVVSDNCIIAESKHFSQARKKNLRLRVPFELFHDQDVQLQILLDGAGEVYIKNAGLRLYA